MFFSRGIVYVFSRAGSCMYFYFAPGPRKTQSRSGRASWPACAALCSAVPCCALLCCAVLCCAVPCRAVPSRAIQRGGELMHGLRGRTLSGAILLNCQMISVDVSAYLSKGFVASLLKTAENPLPPRIPRYFGIFEVATRKLGRNPESLRVSAKPANHRDTCPARKKTLELSAAVQRLSETWQRGKTLRDSAEKACPSKASETLRDLFCISANIQKDL